jgi:hypothetical protein
MRVMSSGPNCLLIVVVATEGRAEAARRPLGRAVSGDVTAPADRRPARSAPHGRYRFFFRARCGRAVDRRAEASSSG